MIIRTNTSWKPKKKSALNKVFVAAPKKKANKNKQTSRPDYTPEKNWRLEDDQTRRLLSLSSASGSIVTSIGSQCSDEELEAREMEAREKYRDKSRRTAPLYPKGPYQYITEETDLSQIGRKQ